MPVGFIAAGTPAITSANGATALTVARPSQAQNGDFLYLVLMAQWSNSGDGTFDAAANGWTQIDNVIDNDTSTRYRLATFWRPATATNSYALNITSTAGTLGRFSGVILAYSGVDMTSPVIGTEHLMAKGSVSATARTAGPITIAAPRYLVAAYIEGPGPITTSDTSRVTVATANTYTLIADSNGTVPAGTVSRSATGTSTSIFVNSITALNAAPLVVPPTITASDLSLNYSVYQISATPSNGGTVAITHNGGSAVTSFGVGQYLILRPTVSPLTVTFTATETYSGGTITSTTNVLVPLRGTAGVQSNVALKVKVGGVFVK